MNGKNVFYVCAATAAAGAIIYLILADGELQTWAVPPETKITLEFILAEPSLEGELSRMPSRQ